MYLMQTPGLEEHVCLIDKKNRVPCSSQLRSTHIQISIGRNL